MVGRRARGAAAWLLVLPTSIGLALTAACRPSTITHSYDDSGADPGVLDASPGLDAAALVDAMPLLSCSRLAHIGDSLTAGTVAPLTAAYAEAGFDAEIDAFGGRAILQKLPDDPHTGKVAAEELVAAGFEGCWVVALGTNDTANIAAGASYSRAEAIDEMMSAIDASGTVQVLWVNTFTELSTGYYANSNMLLWNEALTSATTRWPELIVYDWAAIAATGAAPYYDGVHHTSAGYEVRNTSIATAARSAWPLPAP